MQSGFERYAELVAYQRVIRKELPPQKKYFLGSKRKYLPRFAKFLDFFSFLNIFLKK